MRNLVLSFFFFVLFGTCSLLIFAAPQTNLIPPHNCLLNASTAESVTLTFQISKIKTEQDARTIDEILLQTSIVISSSADFKSGICKVETEKISNKESIIEIICHIAANRLGYPLTAIYIEK